MLQMLQPLMNSSGRAYRKCRNILAKRAAGSEKIATITADGLETVNTTKEGDYIIQNQTKAGEQYVLKAEKFERKYELIGPSAQTGWQEYRPTGKIIALELDRQTLQTLGWTDKIEFTARWGETMIAKAGDFLAMPSEGAEIYRIARKEFFETYAAI